MSPVGIVYFGLALAVGAVATAWGTQRQISAALMLIVSDLFSVFAVEGQLKGWWTISAVFTAFLLIDLALTVGFARFRIRPEPIVTSRWAAALAALHLAMFCAHGAARLWIASGYPFALAAAINGLFLLALMIALIAFIPKSIDQARDVLWAKVTRLKAELSLRSRTEAIWSAMVGNNDKAEAGRLNALIGNRLRQARTYRQESLEFAAKGLGVSRQQLQRLETGASQVPAAALFKLAEYYSVDIRFLMQDLDGEPNFSWMTDPRGQTGN